MEMSVGADGSDDRRHGQGERCGQEESTNPHGSLNRENGRALRKTRMNPTTFATANQESQSATNGLNRGFPAKNAENRCGPVPPGMRFHIRLPCGHCFARLAALSVLAGPFAGANADGRLSARHGRRRRVGRIGNAPGGICRYGRLSPRRARRIAAPSASARRLPLQSEPLERRLDDARRSAPFDDGRCDLPR